MVIADEGRGRWPVAAMHKAACRDQLVAPVEHFRRPTVDTELLVVGRRAAEAAEQLQVLRYADSSAWKCQSRRSGAHRHVEGATRAGCAIPKQLPETEARTSTGLSP